MAIPFEPQLGPPPTDLLQLQLLVAPFPALSGDGQLRELMLERLRAPRWPGLDHLVAAAARPPVTIRLAAV